MTSLVSRKVRTFTAADPLGGDPASDPWREFREVELIDMPLAFRFNHSLGKLSRFYLELESKKLIGTQCPTCGRIWMPPRAMCPEDWAITSWVEVPGRGVLEAASRSAYGTRSDGGTEGRNCRSRWSRERSKATLPETGGALHDHRAETEKRWPIARASRL